MPPTEVTITDMTGELVVIGLAVAVALLFLFFLLGWYFTSRQGAKSPFGGGLLSPCEGLSYLSVEALLRFYEKMGSGDNPVPDLSKAVVCRHTGRIFENALDVFGIIRVHPGFIKKRWSGHLLSWYDLDSHQQDKVLRWHRSVEGFQFDIPDAVFVDSKSYALLGWKKVPGTELEVLVIQKARDEMA